MLHLELLGRVGLREETGRDVDDLLRQSKRLALLAYLALPAPGTWHRRDTLLALFWPEADDTRARTALRNALYVIRQALGEGVVRNRGDEEVSLDPALISCDAARFGAALAEGREQDAVALYHGEFLPGFFVSGSDGFEAWAEEQRRALRTRARAAAVRVSEARAAAGDMAGAIDFAHRALAIEPTEEGALRHLVSLLHASGDRPGALAAYDRFRLRLRAELEADPAPETEALLERIRQRPSAVVIAPAPATAAPAIPADSPAPPGATEASPPPAAAGSSPWARRMPMLLAVGAVLALAAYAAVTRVRPRPASTLPTIVVLPTENASGDSGFDYLAHGLDAGVVDQLRTMPEVSVISAIDAEWVTRPGHDPLAEARKVHGTLVARARLDRDDDSLRVVTRLIEVATGRQRWVESIPFGPARIREAQGRIVAGILGSVLGRYVPRRPAPSPVNPESWRLTLQGRYSLLEGGSAEKARQLLRQATEIDPTNAAAWAGLSSVWASLAVTGLAPEAEAWPRAEQAAQRALAEDSTEAVALANLGVIRAVRDGDVAAGEAMIRRAIALSPADAELRGVILASMLRLDGRRGEALDAIRIAEQVEPLMPFPIGREAFLLLCDGRPAEALARYQALFRLEPEASRQGLVRTLAALGRWDEALAEWRSAAAAAHDTALARQLAAAAGESGYWRVHRFVGERSVRRYSSMPGGTPSPGRLGMAWLQAGDVDRGVALLKEDIRNGGVQVYHLGCHESADGLRDNPKVRELLTTYGRLGTVNRQAAGAVRTGTAR